MHDVTLVYTEYNHRLEVWVLGKRAANTTADRQQYTNTSKVCDDTMSMVLCYIWFFLGFLEIVPKRTKDSWFSYDTVYLNRYVQVQDQLNRSLPFAQKNSRD